MIMHKRIQYIDPLRSHGIYNRRQAVGLLFFLHDHRDSEILERKMFSLTTLNFHPNTVWNRFAKKFRDVPIS